MLKEQQRMKKKTLFIFFAILLICKQGFAQPSPYESTLFFNLTKDDNKWTHIKPKEFESNDIQIMSAVNSKLKYDTIRKAFSFTTNGFEQKAFAIVHKKDTIYIEYPSTVYTTGVFVVSPIPLNQKSYSFFDWKIYDAMYNNHKHNQLNVFYLCSLGYLHTYEMQNETIERLEKNIKWWHPIKLEE